MKLFNREVRIVAILVFSLCFSCAHVTIKNIPEPTENKEQQIKYRKKVPLEFAFAGGIFRNVEPEKANQDLTGKNKKKHHQPKRKRREPKTKQDSLFAAMLKKSQKLRVNEKVKDIIVPAETTTLTKSEQIDKSIVPAPQQTKTCPGIDENVCNKPLTNYREIIYSIRNSAQPVIIVIGRGKKYWIGSLAGIIFKYGTTGYDKTLDWVIEHNKYYRKEADLNMVRTGDKIIFPTKNIIDNLLFAKK